jgi:hypothetical protein
MSQGYQVAIVQRVGYPQTARTQSTWLDTLGANALEYLEQRRNRSSVLGRASGDGRSTAHHPHAVQEERCVPMTTELFVGFQSEAVMNSTKQ